MLWLHFEESKFRSRDTVFWNVLYLFRLLAGFDLPTQEPCRPARCLAVLGVSLLSATLQGEQIRPIDYCDVSSLD
jgi:hypothetical protein